MRKQRHYLGVLALTSVIAGILAGCGVGHVSQTAQATPTPVATATPAAPVVLYQSAWPQGLDAWHPEAGWSIVNGAPQSDMSADLHMTLPYLPTDQPYAVIIPIQIVNVKDFGALFAFGPAPTSSGNGYAASVYSLPASTSPVQFGQHPSIAVYVQPSEAQRNTIQVFDYEPTARMRVYRIEVRANRVDFLADGREMSFATATTDHFAAGPLVLRTQSLAIRLGQVTVETLTS